jgi:hypothetical protein
MKKLAALLLVVFCLTSAAMAVETPKDATAKPMVKKVKKVKVMKKTVKVEKKTVVVPVKK